MYNYKQSIRFIHIKKNGGTSVYKFLKKHNIQVLYGDTTNLQTRYGQHNVSNDYINEKSWKFAVCRNPYYRTVSFFNWIKRGRNKLSTFEQFVIDKDNTGRAKGAWNNQTDYILDKNNYCLVNKIFRFENLSQELPNFFNIDDRFPHLTRSTFDDYDDYYTPELRELVYERLKADFEYFNYKSLL